LYESNKAGRVKIVFKDRKFTYPTMTPLGYPLKGKEE
jgi:hypothetical protein